MRSIRRRASGIESRAHVDLRPRVDKQGKACMMLPDIVRKITNSPPRSVPSFPLWNGDPMIDLRRLEQER